MEPQTEPALQGSTADEAPSPGSDAELSGGQLELSLVLKDFKQDLTLNGITALGTDGVLRSLMADRRVVDAVGLPPRLIKAMLDRMPFDSQNEIIYRGVDGRTAPREQWFHPDSSLLPPPLVLTDEERKQAEAKVEDNRKLLEERPKGGIRMPCIRSDHDLGLKEAASANRQEAA